MPIDCLPSSKCLLFPDNYHSPNSLLRNLIHREQAPSSQSSTNMTCFGATLITVSKLEKQGHLPGNLDWEEKPNFVFLWMAGWFPLGQGSRKNRWEGGGNALRAQANEENQTQNPNGMPTMVPSLPDMWLHPKGGFHERGLYASWEATYSLTAPEFSWFTPRIFLNIIYQNRFQKKYRLNFKMTHSAILKIFILGR